MVAASECELRCQRYLLNLKEKIVEIQSLTISERILLAEALWDSVVAENADIPLSESQRDELDHRLSAFEIDQDEGDSWSEVKARVLSKR
ncbi:hypothetical protein GCM10007426_17310 [Alloalcanivorax dieselolei]|nr:hypothetical protein GCM10007426_17310 [Alloalcanivorax dieselolei]